MPLNYILKSLNRLKDTILRKKPKIDYNISSNKHVLRGEYYFSFSKSIVEHSIKNPDILEKLVTNLDQKSRNVIHTVFGRLYYIYTHNILERDKIISKGEIRKYIKVQKIMKEYEKRSNFLIKDYDSTIFYYRHGLKYIPNNVINNLKNTDFIDGGAYLGDSALMFEKYYQQRSIISFEPNKKNFNQLVNTIKLNSLRNIIPVKMGLGSKINTLKIRDLEKASYISDEGSQEVNITTLDTYVENNNLSVGLIKLDIEGYGFEAIKGAKKTIIKYKPVLLISIYHNGDEFFEIKRFLENLNLKYKIIIRKLAPLKPFFDTTLIAWIKL